jgi:SulP family sulfate permease
VGAASQLLVKLPLPAHVRSDVAGGLVSAAVAVPLAMGYGMFAFVALGPEYFVHGAFAGLLTAAVVGLAKIALGDKSAHIYAPRVTTTFFIGILLYGLLHSDAPAMSSGGVAVALAVISAIMLLGGAFQALFGLGRLGTVIKLIPQPVMSGFHNAAALILFLVQIGNVFGFDDSPSFIQALGNALHAKPLSILVAAVAAAAMWHSRRFLPKVPPLVVGLAAGTALYYALRLASLGAHLGATLGTVPFGTVELPSMPHFGELWRMPGIAALVPTIVGGALALAVIGSIDALLCTKILTVPGEPKIDGDRLLLRLGAANVLSAALGGITGGLNIGRAARTANSAAARRSRWPSMPARCSSCSSSSFRC